MDSANGLSLESFATTVPASVAGATIVPRPWVDGDDDQPVKHWSEDIAPEILEKMTNEEKKRQEIIDGMLW